MPEDNANLPVPTEDTPKPVGLKRWERHLARWLATQYGRYVGREEMVQKASQFANKDVKWAALRRTLRNPIWRQLNDRMSDDLTVEILGKAKARSIRASKHSAAVLELSLKRARDILADPEAGQENHLAVIRAVGPLVGLTQDRIWPKKTEHEVNTNVRIELTSHQVSRMDAPEMRVEAEEVPYQIIAEESDAA